jgi:hypothetical protein
LKFRKQLILLGGGAEGIRTPDPHNAIVVLYQLSYDPIQRARESRMSGRIVKVFHPGIRALVKAPDIP